MYKFLASPSSLGLVLLIVGLAATVQLATCEPYPWAENVCNKSVPIKKDIIINKPIEYEIRVLSMCGILPCVKTRVETRQDETIKTIVVQQERVACCDGYAETPSRQCAPICLESCNSGKCVAPNVCKCQPEPSDSAPGFVGPTCKRFTCLANGRWGAKCERECATPCSPNSYCSADTGKCLCYPGWHGPDCAQECDANSDVDDCQESNKLPEIVEPNANLLFNENVQTLPRTQRPQALILTDDSDSDEVKIVSSKVDQNQAWSFASGYLIGVLSLMSLIFLFAFLIVKKRYRLVRDEHYYGSAAGGSSSGRPSSGSEYTYGDGSNYYAASLSSGRDVDGGNLEKNLSFATATRNLLSGVVTGGAGKRAAAENRHPDSKSGLGVNKLPLFAPRVESHLIQSQKQAEQNIYSEIDLAAKTRAASNSNSKSVANRPRAETPPASRRRLSSAADEDHIYAVPKMPSITKRVNHHDDTSETHDISVELPNCSGNDEIDNLPPGGANSSQR